MAICWQQEEIETKTVGTQLKTHLSLRLCLFWVKITSENAFPYLRVFGCAWKMHFSEMHFSWPVLGCKLISIFILPSNTIFRKIEREMSEREITLACTKRERERERERGDRTQKTTSTYPETDSDKPRKPKTKLVRRADCTTGEIVAPQHWSTQNRSFSSHPKTDRPWPRFVVPDRDLAFASIAIAAPRRAILPSPPPRDLTFR